MIYKTVYVQNTFEAGVAVGSLRAFLAGQSAGELTVIRELEDSVEVEIACYSHLVMAYAESQLAAFV